MTTIVACGGPIRRLLDYLLGLTGKEDPTVCVLGTATGDASLAGYYELFSGERCRPTHVALFGIPRPDWREHLLSRDLVFVGGGGALCAGVVALSRSAGSRRV